MPEDTHAPLDSLTLLHDIDTHGTVRSLIELGDQIQDIWEISQRIQKIDLSQIETIVVAGMGGSILGTETILSVYKQSLPLPIVICPDYSLPAYVGKKSLVIASSYSGTTIETVTALKDAISRGALVAGITSGGDVASLIQAASGPLLTFPTEHNPSAIPRMALGYSIFGQIALFARLGIISLSNVEYMEVLNAVANAQMAYGFSIPQESNPAKLLAFELYNRLPLIIPAEHLEGAAKVFLHQLHENAKQLSALFAVPEMNHHLLEALKYPQQTEMSSLALTFHSQLYSSENARRVEVSEEIFANHSIEVRSLDLQSPSRISQSFELITFAGYVALYLALLNGVDPGATKQVEYLKATLKVQ